MHETEVREIVARVLAKLDGEAQSGLAAVLPDAAPNTQSIAQVPVEASARHMHLTTQAVEQLFGKGARLTKKRELSQPGEFLSEQRVKLVTARGQLESVAVLGPERPAVQVELSLTDCRALGIQAPIRLSGDLTGAGDLLLVGDRGSVAAPGSAIVAANHIHMTPAEAKAFGLQNGDSVDVEVAGMRSVVFRRVAVRVKDGFALAMHLDFDEANACGLICGTLGTILGRRLSPGIATLATATPQVPIEPSPPWDRVITEAVAKRLCSAGDTCIALPHGTILTPSARDIFAQSHVRVTIQ